MVAQTPEVEGSSVYTVSEVQMDRNHDWYTNHDWRNAYLEETIRHLSKTGSLGADEVLSELAGVLPKEDVILLYTTLRQAGRPEREWRHEFLATFSGVQESDLPPIMYDQPPLTAGDIPEHFRPSGVPLNIESDEDIPF